MSVTLRGSGPGLGWPRAVVLVLVATVVLGGCSQLAGVLASGLPSPAVILPSAGPETPIPTIATHPPAAASAGAGGHVGSHAIVCVAPVTPGAGGGPPCVPVSDALVISTALEALDSTERAAVVSSRYVAGDAGCTGVPLPRGCLAPDSPEGIVTFQLRDGLAQVRALVYRGADGTLGATRLG